MSTTPGCAYVGGHAEGYDDECAWCHAAATLDEPSTTIDVRPDGSYRISAPSAQVITFQDTPEPRADGEFTIARRGPTPRCGECYQLERHAEGCSRGWPSLTVEVP